MKKRFLSLVVVAMSLLTLPAFSQADKDTTALLGLAGDNLDLYAVLTLFQKSKTIEAFEKSLNDTKTAINNLDLNLDKNIDFIKVVTRKKDESYSFILQVDISKTETQDVAVILVDRDKDKKVSMQIVGDEELYGKDYVVEPKGNSAITANPGYTGADPVTINVPAPTTTTVVVQSAPIVEYVYSPAYIPYVPPYYYGFYPPYFGLSLAIGVGIYRASCWGYHGGYYGGHYGGGNTVVINNRNNYNNYNNNRNTSNTVANNKAKGNYGNGNGNRASASTRDAGGASNRKGNGASASTRDGAGPAQPRQGNGASASTRDAGGASSRQGNGASASTRDAGGGSMRQSPSASSRQSSYGGSSSSSRNMGGGGSSMNRGGGGGGMSRGGGGGGGRRR